MALFAGVSDLGMLGAGNQSIPTNAFRRVVRELADLQKNPPEGIRIQTNEDNILDLTGIIEGPGKCHLNCVCLQPYSSEGTPYAGGYFRIKFKFTEEFPAAPPKCMSVRPCSVALDCINP